MKTQVSKNACWDFTRATDCNCHDEATASIQGIFTEATPLELTPELKKRFRKWGKKPMLFQHKDWILVVQNEVIVCIDKI